MKYISIVILILCIHVSVALVNGLHVFPQYMLPHEKWWSNIDKTNLDQQTYIKGEVDTDYDFGVGDLVKALWLFVYTFGFGVIVVPYTFVCMGLPVSFSLILSMPVYAAYALGWFQILSNRTTVNMR